MGVQRPGHVDSDCPGVLRVRERTEEQEGDGIWGSVGVRRTSIAGRVAALTAALPHAARETDRARDR